MPDSGVASGQRLVTELKVSGHLMTLDTGVFCVFPAPGAQSPDAATGLPGARISLPPAASSKPDMVTIRSLHEDGWLNGPNTAVLVQVARGPVQVLVTVYQDAASQHEAPRLQVMRLSDAGPAAAAAAVGPAQPAASAQPAPAPQPAASSAPADIAAHVQRLGDIGAQLGEWVGEPNSQRWIEGFAIAPQALGLGSEDIEYQAVLGRGWLSPWAEGGQYCGSRGMALPILGLRVRLRGHAAETHDCTVAATFVDGTSIGPVPAGEPCEAESLAPLEAFQVLIRPKAAGAVPDQPGRQPEPELVVAGDDGAERSVRGRTQRSASGRAKAAAGSSRR